MRRFQKSEIRGYIATGAAVDISGYSWIEIKELRQRENGFDVVGTSYSQIGITGGIAQGRETGTLYAVLSRCSALLQIF